jgi:molecular chaperone GrpE (heat shock protein)
MSIQQLIKTFKSFFHFLYPKQAMTNEPTPQQEQMPLPPVVEPKVSEAEPVIEQEEEILVEPTQDEQEQPNQVDVLIEGIKADLALRSQQEAAKDAIIQRMSKQIETYEVGVFRKIKDGLLSDLILLYDSIEKIEHRFSHYNDSKLSSELELLKEEIEEILFRNDVEKIVEPTVKYYDRTFHKVIGKEQTDIEAEHLMVIRTAKQGFKADDRILRKQEVYVKEYTHISENNSPQN